MTNETQQNREATLNPDGSVIKADEIRKLYGDVPAVDGISFAVEPGETYGLLGPNGAGKTTTMRMPGCLLRTRERSPCLASML